MLKTIAIERLKPNPYRDLENYEIIREKVEALKQSISQTGFWGTIVGRPQGRDIEIAFGHHRLVALREGAIVNDHVEIIVRDLTNAQMLQMMANENLEEWGHSAIVEMETVRAVIGAAKRGEIRTKSQSTGNFSEVVVARFLGWTRRNGKEPNYACEVAFHALGLVDRGLITISDLHGLNRKEVDLLAKSQDRIHEVHEQVANRLSKTAEREQKRAAVASDPGEKRRFQERASVTAAQATHHREAARTKAIAFAEDASRKLKSGAGRDAIAQQALAIEMTAPQERKIHDVDDLANKLARHLEAFADGTDLVSKEFETVKEFMSDLSEEAANGLRQSFRKVISRLNSMHDVFKNIPRSHYAGTHTGQGPKAITNGRSTDE